MIVHIVCGSKGSGKTTYIKERLEKVSPKNVIVYDINDEYEEFTGEHDPAPPIEEFCRLIQQVKGGVIIIEEATIFFTSRSTNKDLIHSLTRTRHSRNMIFLVFHSVRTIPKNIYDISEYLTLFKTKDDPDHDIKYLKSSELVTAVKELQEDKDPHAYRILKLR